MATEADGGDLWAYHKEDLDAEWHEVFDELTAQGKSPSGIKATIEYVTTPKTQKEVAREMNVVETTIRNLQAAVIALGPVESRVASDWQSGGRSSMDLCTHIADALDWEEGVEYSVTRSMAGSSPQPNLKKPGWVDLHNTIVVGEGDGEGSEDGD